MLNGARPGSWWWRVVSVPIGFKIMGIVLFLIFLLGGSLTLQTLKGVRSLTEDQLTSRGAAIGHELADHATSEVLTNDLYTLHRLVMATARNHPEVEYILVEDSDRQVLADTFGGKVPLDVYNLERNDSSGDPWTRFTSDRGTIREISVPMLDGQAGTVRVGLKESLVLETLRYFTANMLTTTLFVSAVGLLIALVLTRFLTQPVEELRRLTTAVASGRFDGRAQVTSDDEIGQLSGNFNSMTAELENLMRQVREKEAARERLLRKLITAQEDERKRVARELHDETSQQLTSILLGIRELDRSCGDPALQAHLDELRRIVDKTLKGAHYLAFQLRPSVLDDLGLVEALRHFVRAYEEQYGLVVDIEVQGVEDLQLPGEIETGLYRIIQEALVNVARHAEARNVSLILARRGTQLEAIVEDDGRGLPPDARNGEGFGLSGMEERAYLLGGFLHIESVPESGTTVFVRLPLQEEWVREVNRLEGTGHAGG